MRLLTLVAFLLLSSQVSFAQKLHLPYERCYSQMNNACIITLVEEETGTPTDIFFNAADNLPVDSAIVQEYKNLGIEFKVLSPEEFRPASKVAVNTATVNDLEQEVRFYPVGSRGISWANC